MSGKRGSNSERIFGIVTVLCAAFMCAQYSYRLRADTTHEMIYAAYGTLHGKPGGPEVQNRLIFPVLMTAGRSALPASVSDVNLWKGLRLLTALIGFASAFACMRAISGSWFRATIGCMLLGYGYLWTICSFKYEHSSDFLDLAFIAAFVWLALRGRYGWLAVMTVLASFNRESAAFSGLIVVGLAMARHGLAPAAWKGLAIGGCNVALAFITVTAVRSLYRGPAIHQHVGLSDVIENWRWALMPYGPATALLAMVAPLALMNYNFHGSFSTPQRGLLLGCLGCFLVTAVFGILFELRVLLPCYLILICVLVLDESSPDDRSWIARAC
ncbi:MAG TPA: hypothetical protein VG433_05545, partial [Pirellulales bacterium]|nr:hypothetical protein [Pirellulales bacterium]